MAEDETTAPTTVATTAAVTIEPANGNGKRQLRLDLMLGFTMAGCLVMATVITGLMIWQAPEGGAWQAADNMRASLFQFARDILIGYVAVSVPKAMK